MPLKEVAFSQPVITYTHKFVPFSVFLLLFQSNYYFKVIVFFTKSEWNYLLCHFWNHHCADVVLLVVLNHFASALNPVIHRPHIGASLTLRCRPPKSFPEGMVYWGEYKIYGRLEPLEPTDRISLDYDGIMLFAVLSCFSFMCICFINIVY